VVCGDLAGHGGRAAALLGRLAGVGGEFLLIVRADDPRVAASVLGAGEREAHTLPCKPRRRPKVAASAVVEAEPLGTVAARTASRGASRAHRCPPHTFVYPSPTDAPGDRALGRCKHCPATKLGANVTELALRDGAKAGDRFFGEAGAEAVAAVNTVALSRGEKIARQNRCEACGEHKRSRIHQERCKRAVT